MAQYRITGEQGINCPKCARPTQTREHTELRAKHFKQPYYFKKWYYCTNQSCPVTTHMAEEHKVWNKNKAANQYKMVAEDIENQARIFNI